MLQLGLCFYEVPLLNVYALMMSYRTKWIISLLYFTSYWLYCTSYFTLLYLILVQEYVQLLYTNSQISLIEFIWNIPTQRSKFPPFLNQCMEETEAIQQLLEFNLLTEHYNMIKSHHFFSKCFHFLMPPYIGVQGRT